MPRWIFAAAGIALFALFIVLILWPSGERRAFFEDAPQGTATYEEVDWDRYEGDPRAGEALAQELCAPCHAVGASGDSPVGEAPPFRQFANMWPLEYLEEALGEGIMVGHTEHQMPVFQFDTKQIIDLTAYLEEVGDANRE